MGEVHHPGRLVDDDDAERNERVESARRDAGRQQVAQHQHARALVERGDSYALRLTVSEPDPADALVTLVAHGWLARDRAGIHAGLEVLDGAHRLQKLLARQVRTGSLQR